jgi:hypothetical protein
MAPAEEFKVFHFDEAEYYAAWLVEEGPKYQKIEVLSSTKTITIRASGTTNIQPLLKGRLFVHMAKEYPSDMLMTLPIEGMIIDALNGCEKWDVVLKMLKSHSMKLPLSAFYRLWKENTEIFERVKKPEYGWGDINSVGAAFLCRIDDDFFTQYVFSTCSIVLDDVTLPYAVHTKSGTFLKCALERGILITVCLLLAMHKNGLTDLVPKAFEKNLPTEHRDLFLQFLAFSDPELLIKLLPKVTKSISPSLVVALRSLGLVDILEKARELERWNGF